MSGDNDEQMSGSEVARIFNEPTPVEKEAKENDLMRIAARVKNKARMMCNGNLTPVGDILCNSYCHVLNRLYKFSEGLSESDKLILHTILRSTEDMPGEVIVASKSHVVPPKGR